MQIKKVQEHQITIPFFENKAIQLVSEGLDQSTKNQIVIYILHLF